MEIRIQVPKWITVLPFQLWYSSTKYSWFGKIRKILTYSKILIFREHFNFSRKIQEIQ